MRDMDLSDVKSTKDEINLRDKTVLSDLVEIKILYCRSGIYFDVLS